MNYTNIEKGGSMELLEVVDENNNLIGIKEDKEVIHKKDYGIGNQQYGL